MADSTIVLRSPVKSASSSLTCSSPNSPTHHGTVIILKDNNSNDQKPLPPPPRIPRTSSSTRNASSNHLSLPSLNAVQSKLYFAGHTGLYNLGNTCYVNCVLQLLSHVPQFCDAICSMSFESLGLEQPSDVPMVASSHNPTRLKGGGRGLLKAFEAQPRRVPCYLAYELHGTFNIIWSGKCMVYSPLNMVAAVRRLLPSFEPCAMEDAQEFLEALLAAVTDEIKANKLADSNVISDLLGFSSESQILCEQCHRLSVTKTDETFITLTFSEKMLCDSRGSTRRRSCHLTEMLAHFYQWEALSTPFQCSNCAVRSPTKEGTKAQKRLLISKLPQVLHVVLRRFRSLPQTHLRRPKARQARQLSHKITMHVNFDEYLDMAPYCAQPLNTSLSSSCAKHVKSSLEECFYRLRGVIVHYGKSINTGHFVAFVYNDTLGEWLRCDDHIIEQTTFESVKTSDAYILVYSRCASKSTLSPVLANASGEEKILSDTIASPVTCQLRKRKRAISVDQLNEQREDVSIGEVKNEMKKENFEKQFGLSKSLQFLCMNLGPLANGLRRRAQSLNFVIHSNQQSIVDSTQQTISTIPVTKRRRKEPIAKLSSSHGNLSQCVTTAQSKPVSSSIRKPVIPTRKKFSPTILMTNDLLSHPDKLIKTTRKRRRTDPFIRKRRLKQTAERKTQQKMNLSNLIAVPSIGQTLSPSESLVPSVQSSLSFTYETPINSTTPITKRIGRIRMQRCVDGPNTNATVRLISSGESHTRLSLPCQTTLQSSSLLTNLISARRSNSLNNTVSNPSSC